MKKAISLENVAPALRGKMRRNSLFLFFIFITFLSAYSQAQEWSGVLAPSRAMDWSNAGADPVYVNEARSQCGSTIAPIGSSGAPASSSAINTAISNCASSHPLSGVGGYVQLAAGSFYLNSQINMASNVTLRGMGANQTFIYFSGSSSSCPFSGGCDIQITAPNVGLGYDGSRNNQVNWTGGYAQGVTSITVSSTSNLQVGSLVFLDQTDTANSPPPATGLAICRDGSCGGSNVSGRPGRSLTEPQVVTSISGTTVGITPGIRTPNWFTSGKSPQMWWNNGLPIQRVGIESMGIDISNALSRFSTVLCMGCYNVWIKNVRFSDTHGDTETGADGFYHFYPIQSMRVTMRDSYAVGSPPVSNYYVMSCWTSGDELYENNIRQHIAFGFMHEGCVGSVASYNFDVDDYYKNCHGCSTDTGWQQASSYRHGGTDALGLFEGNEGIGVIGDEVFGASTHFTVFRNFYNGRDPNGGSSGGKTEQTNAVLLYPRNRFWNIIGNVLGTAGYHNTYSCAAPSTSGNCGNNTAQIYSLGYANGYAGGDEAYTATSMLRWGNYDTVNNAVRWVASEVPSGLADGFANPVPASQSLPVSFLYNTQPSWWPTGYPWPPIGPDVTCTAGKCITSGSGAAATLGSHANHNPAGNCYFNVMKGPASGGLTVLNYDASLCYSTSASQAPDPPTGLSVVVQ